MLSPDLGIPAGRPEPHLSRRTRVRPADRCIAWRTSSGASLQSRAENAVSRFKALVGETLASQTLERQQVEVLVKSQVLNRMAALGMPRSERSSES